MFLVFVPLFPFDLVSFVSLCNSVTEAQDSNMTTLWSVTDFIPRNTTTSWDVFLEWNWSEPVKMKLLMTRLSGSERSSETWKQSISVSFMMQIDPFQLSWMLFPVSLSLREQIRIPRGLAVMGGVASWAAARCSLIRLIILLHRTLAING